MNNPMRKHICKDKEKKLRGAYIAEYDEEAVEEQDRPQREARPGHNNQKDPNF